MAHTALATVRGWRSFELHLVTAGMALSRPMLTIQPLDAQALRYQVPAAPHLVRLVDGTEWLEWQQGYEVRALSPVAGGCLADFIRLDEAAAERVLAFAAAWGPIYDTGWTNLGPSSEHTSWHFSEPLPGGALREPLDGWRGRARQLGALLRAAASLQQGEPIAWADRSALLYGGHQDPSGSRRLGAQVMDLEGRARVLLPPQASLDEQGRTLVALAAEWIPPSDLVLRPEWDAEARAVAIGIRFLAQRQPLVAVLGIELAAALTSPAGLWSCDGCAYPYTPSRRPRGDRRRFCPVCSSSRAPARLWWREHRSRLRQKGTTNGEAR
jgi:hypothetical protein